MVVKKVQIIVVPVQPVQLNGLLLSPRLLEISTKEMLLAIKDQLEIGLEKAKARAKVLWTEKMLTLIQAYLDSINEYLNEMDLCVSSRTS